MQKDRILKSAGARPVKRKKLALGKGLDALIPAGEARSDQETDYFFCDIDLIRPNPFQPRLDFSEQDLAELTESIRTQGVLQPLLVRKDDPGYELIAGERRLRAARRAGLARVPVIVKQVGDDKLLEMSLVENIQRENLNPIEEADAYHRLITQLNLTQDQAAARVGKSRSAVANFIRLRQLPDPIKASIIEGALSMGHARALLGVETAGQQLAVWRTVISRGLSVRKTEILVRRLKGRQEKKRVSAKRSEQIHLDSLADDLSRHLGTRVAIKKHGRKGKVEIEFYGHDDLDRLIRRLKQVQI